MEAVAKLKNYPTSPRKMRLLADEIRGLQVEKALALLEHHPQHSSTPLHKLLWSAVKNAGDDAPAAPVPALHANLEFHRPAGAFCAAMSDNFSI